MSAAGSKSRSYQDSYRRVFASLARPLTSRDGVAETSISRAEKRLGVRLPGALREYYLVAGKEPVFNQVHNRLLLPDEWEVHSRKFIFMEENQAAVVWSVSARSEPIRDPAVFQGPMFEGEPSGWYREHAHCSVFLVTMLHWHAVLGGMACRASAAASKTLRTSLDKQLQFAGEVNGMRAYRPRRGAVCFLKWPDLFDANLWRVFAGAGTRNDLDAIAKNLGLQWD